MNADRTMLAAYDLLAAVTALTEILDQPVDEKGGIKVMWKHAAELIVTAQITARNFTKELDSQHIALESIKETTE